MLESATRAHARRIVVTARPHEPFDSACSRTRASTRREKRYLMLKSRIHYRAGFKPIASHIVECAGGGVTNADLSVYGTDKLARPIYPLDPMCDIHVAISTC